MSLSEHYVGLARSANRIALLLRRLGGDGEHWRGMRDRYMGFARQQRGYSTRVTMIACCVAGAALAAPAMVLEHQAVPLDPWGKPRTVKEVRYQIGEPLVPWEEEDESKERDHPRHGHQPGLR